DRQGHHYGAQGKCQRHEPTGPRLGFFVHIAGCEAQRARDIDDAKPRCSRTRTTGNHLSRGKPMSAENILVIDDEPQIRRVMRSTLSSHGYVITEAITDEEGVDAVRKNKPDLVLLDMNMPGIGGLEACKEIRESTDAPIIMLTVRNAERDPGADDCVVKPFGIEELLARVRSALRRYAPGDAVAPFVTKEIAIDFEARTVNVRGNDVHLTPKEFDVLKLLVANQGKPLTHRRLLQAVWGPDYGEETENLRVVINQLRKKLEADPAKP